jgi:hypothetical protein
MQKINVYVTYLPRCVFSVGKCLNFLLTYVHTHIKFHNRMG